MGAAALCRQAGAARRRAPRSRTGSGATRSATGWRTARPPQTPPRPTRPWQARRHRSRVRRQGGAPKPEVAARDSSAARPHRQRRASAALASSRRPAAAAAFSRSSRWARASRECRAPAASRGSVACCPGAPARTRSSPRSATWRRALPARLGRSACRRLCTASHRVAPPLHSLCTAYAQPRTASAQPLQRPPLQRRRIRTASAAPPRRRCRGAATPPAEALHRRCRGGAATTPHSLAQPVQRLAQPVQRPPPTLDLFRRAIASRAPK